MIRRTAAPWPTRPWGSVTVRLALGAWLILAVGEPAAAEDQPAASGGSDAPSVLKSDDRTGEAVVAPTQRHTSAPVPAPVAAEDRTEAERAALRNRASDLWTAGRQDEALALLGQAIARFPGDARNYLQRGTMYGERGDSDAAISDLRQSAELAPDSADAWGNLGWHLILDGKFAEARRVTEKAHVLDPEFFGWTVNLGHTYLLQGDRKAARDWYAKTVPLVTDQSALERGPLADFDIFIRRGWQVEASREERSWLEAAASKAHAEQVSALAAPADFEAQPLAPLIPGAWQPLPVEDVQRVLSITGRQYGQSEDELPTVADLQAFGVVARALPLSFYASARIIELDATDEEGPSEVFTLIESGAGITILNGTSPPIHDLNAKLPIRLDTAEQAAEYLRFFCAAVHGDMGAFRLIETPEDIPWRPDAESAQKAATAPLAIPIRLEQQPDGAWRASAVVLYGGALLQAEFAMRAGGMVEMLGDSSITEGLAVAYEHFETNSAGRPMRRRDDRPDVFSRMVELAEAGRQIAEGREHQAARRYAEAAGLFRKALDTQRRLFEPGDPRLAQALLQTVNALVSLGRVSEATPLFFELMKLSNLYIPSGMETLLVEGRITSDVGSDVNAVLGDLGGRIMRSQPRDAEYVSMFECLRLSLVSMAHRSAGRYDEADPLSREALVISRTILPKDNPFISWNLDILAGLLETTGRYDEAEPLYREALALRRAKLPEGEKDIAISLTNLAGLLATTGRYGEAERLFREALPIRRSALPEGHPGIVGDINDLADLLATTGRYGEAEALYREGLGILRAGKPMGQWIAQGLNDLARLLATTGRYDEAEPLYREALGIWRAALPEGHPETAAGLQNLANLLATTGRYREAEPLYLDALAIRRVALPQSHPDIAASLYGLGDLLTETDRASEAEPLFHEALRIADGAGMPEMVWRVQGSVSKHFAARGQRAFAVFFGKQAVNALQSVRQNLTAADQATQEAFLASKESYYRDLADLLIAEGRLPEAQKVLRMLKEQEFHDFIRRDATDDPRQTRVGLNAFEGEQKARLDVPGQTLAALGAELRKLRALKVPTPDEEARIAALEAEQDRAAEAFATALDEINAAFAAQQQALTLERGHELDARIRRAGNEMTDLLGALEKKSGQRVALVQYLVMPDKLHILLTQGDSIRAVPVALSEADLNRAIQTFRDEHNGPLLRPDLDPLPQAQWFYQQLIAPIAAELEAGKAQVLMVYLDGALRYLPLAALHDGEHYLVERYGLAVYTAVKDDNLREKPLPGWQLAGFGVSAGHDEVGPTRRRFRGLPGVPGELNGIVKHSKKDKDGVLPGRVYLDADFTAAALTGVLREAHHRVIHLATHFALESGDDDSFLLLGDGSALTLRDLRRQRFGGVDLVALSACDTAVELTAHAGREVEGLGTVVQQRGARGVIATLWPVADASTGIFMQSLYRLRAKQGLTKAEALRQAQLALMHTTAVPPQPGTRGWVDDGPAASQSGAADPEGRNRGLTPKTYAHPYYWAPFILMGNWL